MACRRSGVQVPYPPLLDSGISRLAIHASRLFSWNLGRDLSEAERRRDRIQTLYRESEAARQSYAKPPSWTECALAAARSISQGVNQVPVPSHETVNEVAEAGDDKSIWIGHYDPCWDALSPEAMFWSHGVALANHSKTTF